MKQWIGLGLLLCCLEACAIADEGNRRVLNYLDADWSPPTTAGRVLAAPLALPVGVVAAAAAGVALVGSLEVEGVVVVVGCCCCSSPRRRVRCSNLCSRMRCASGSASVVVVVVDDDEG